MKNDVAVCMQTKDFLTKSQKRYSLDEFVSQRNILTADVRNNGNFKLEMNNRKMNLHNPEKKLELLEVTRIHRTSCNVLRAVGNHQTPQYNLEGIQSCFYSPDYIEQIRNYLELFVVARLRRYLELLVVIRIQGKIWKVFRAVCIHQATWKKFRSYLELFVLTRLNTNTQKVFRVVCNNQTTWNNLEDILTCLQSPDYIEQLKIYLELCVFTRLHRTTLQVFRVVCSHQIKQNNLENIFRFVCIHQTTENNLEGIQSCLQSPDYIE